MLVYLIRHGMAQNDDLTHDGKKQVKYACKYLKDCGITKIYCSTYNRCIQTANIISKCLNLKYTVEDALKERVTILPNQHDYENDEWYQNYLNPNYSNTDMEGCKEFFDRTYNFLQKIKEAQGNVLLVAHSCTSYALNNCFFDFPKDNLLIWSRMGNASIICYNLNQLKSK